ncbi:type IVB secretion system protein IcmG/DotF [Legionella sp. W05-934-2]|jgi:intracellular multiplication protein IcmG|uniref:type IVB secretion system protein IcmG/DotF n=1 Tax=Legionella sp. W05-934-2 TaxID=1198649 RepID=UPI003461D7DF
MADTKDNNEGYEFPELDGYSPEGYEEAPSDSQPTQSSMSTSGFSLANINPVWRNAGIVIAGVVVLMLAYKYFGGIFSTSKKAPSEISSIPKQPPIQPPIPQPKIVEPTPKPKPDESMSKQVRQNLAKLELSQQNLSSNVSDIESKLNGLDGNVTDLSDKLATINQQLADIAEKLDGQGNVINLLKAKLTPKSKPKPKKILPPPIQYSIQAVIPGRAWLIGSNGSTITVSKGSRIASYGIVRIIDAQMGRVVTSSGKVIQFEQEDF